MAPEKDDEALRLFSAFRDASELLESGAPGHEKQIAASTLIGYARRKDAVADFEIERALRANPRARQIYDGALASRALARSDMAMAAAGGTEISRLVEGHRVELVEEAAGVYLVVYVAEGTEIPKAIEVRTPDGNGARLALGEPIGGIIQLRLDIKKPQPQALYQALGRTDSTVFLM